MKSTTPAFERLTGPQQFELLDVVARGSLIRSRAGYVGTIAHRHRTMLALVDAGLCVVGPNGLMPTDRGERLCGGKLAAQAALVAMREATR